MELDDVIMEIEKRRELLTRQKEATKSVDMNRKEYSERTKPKYLKDISKNRCGFVRECGDKCGIEYIDDYPDYCVGLRAPCVVPGSDRDFEYSEYEGSACRKCHCQSCNGPRLI